jgi:ribonucleotide monophosphatase NagD (HAD superfamily)
VILRTTVLFSLPLRYLWCAPGVVEREPIVTGKPSPFLMQDIAAKHGVQPARSIMVGDRLDTDILWGLNTGMATLLVMTGAE